MREGTVLVTGGAGYIGSHAVLALLDAGWKVVVVDNLITGFDWAVDRRATLVVANIADDDKVRAAIREHGVFAIMHFAGSVVVPESVTVFPPVKVSEPLPVKPPLRSTRLLPVLMTLPRTLGPPQSSTDDTNGTGTPGAANVTIEKAFTTPSVGTSTWRNSVPEQPAQALRRSK